MKNVLEYLENSGMNFPQKTAVQDENTSLTYSELILKAKKAGSIIAKNLPPFKPVPVLLEKSADTLAVFFGAIYAGCCYVSVNPALPQSRIKSILQVLDTDYIITSHENDDILKDLPEIKTVLYTEDFASAEPEESCLLEIRNNITDTLPLYINFTSGSTGTPKGVVVSHRSVIDFIDIFTELFNITEDDVIANQAPFDFDVSVKDIYSSIKAGATLQIVPKALFSAPAQLVDFLCERKVTTMIWAVSALCLMTTFHALDYKAPPYINKVLFSGETMPVKHLKTWMKHYPEAMFVNLFGPTEITCNCTYHILSDVPENEKNLPIGIPFPNEKVFLLDENNSLVTAPEISGEICVAGTALSLGYYNNEAETQKRFIQNPINKSYIEPIYKTGDIGYYGNDGLLYFAGRRDFQIKYLGHRIELEEIEKYISDLQKIDRVCCVFEESKSKLAAFYVGDITPKEIKSELSASLPYFMLPGTYIKLDSIPLTPNGKADRKKLKEQITR